MTGTLRGGLKLKDPTGPISCHPRAAVVTTVTRSRKNVACGDGERILLVSKIWVGGIVCGVGRWPWVYLGSKTPLTPSHTHTQTDAWIMHTMSGTQVRPTHIHTCMHG